MGWEDKAGVVAAGGEEDGGLGERSQAPAPVPSLAGLGAEALAVLGVAVERAELDPPSLLTTADLVRALGALGLGRSRVRGAVRALAACGALVREASGGAWVPVVRPTGEAFEVDGPWSWASVWEVQGVLSSFFGSNVSYDLREEVVEVKACDAEERPVWLLFGRALGGRGWEWTTGERSGEARTVAEVRAVAQVVFDAWCGRASAPSPSEAP